MSKILEINSVAGNATMGQIVILRARLAVFLASLVLRNVSVVRTFRAHATELGRDEL